MCDTCGCPSPSDHSHDHNHDHSHGHSQTKTVDVHASLFAANDALARANREHFDEIGAVALNLISSPGSGKTTLLEHTIEALKGEINIGVIEGDIETERDADRIRAKGVPVVQLTTGGACHLDAAMTHKGFHRLQKEPGGDKIDLLFIENVGNLVCPSTFDLGEHERVVFVSVPEGPDKPSKYPKAFTSSQTFVITKTDLLPYFDFPVEEARGDALRLNPNLRTMELASPTGEGMEKWLDYLRELVAAMKARKNL
ncbi:hydrogenase nickel incorporation protein HypB [Desulforhopalus sp. IMCC35007]|uniref:hydrogenase nickel incorporation protein HypB n=1 Tax=Desulforhopalus sp. IMCC35007 TaxID=2569543 RepID=UPI0010ADB240|nr:hydrogenase nickel incorporation protein HypB [Desulforhopalus sp. IMCC35007]TKB09927.1 hydrogenase nickel incorporation protein HypB [Desulforhopalus sp. IMCC35007]